MNPQPSQSWLSANIKSILSVLVIVLTFSYFFVCFITSVKPDPQILIAVVAANGQVLSYWFGSSSGSSKKDDAMTANLGNPSVTGDNPTINVATPPENPVNKVE